MEGVTRLVSQRPVVIFSKRSCCMSYTVKTLFSNFGVNPLVYELDEDPKGRDLERTLTTLGRNPAVPTVFIGGELVGGANEVMNLHLSGSLVPLLKTVGAIWV